MADNLSDIKDIAMIAMGGFAVWKIGDWLGWWNNKKDEDAGFSFWGNATTPNTTPQAEGEDNTFMKAFKKFFGSTEQQNEKPTRPESMPAQTQSLSDTTNANPYNQSMVTFQPPPNTSQLTFARSVAAALPTQQNGYYVGGFSSIDGGVGIALTPSTSTKQTATATAAMQAVLTNTAKQLSTTKR